MIVQVFIENQGELHFIGYQTLHKTNFGTEYIVYRGFQWPPETQGPWCCCPTSRARRPPSAVAPLTKTPKAVAPLAEAKGGGAEL